MKMSIKTKLFFTILAVLSINIIVVLLFGSTFLEGFYIHSTKKELNRYRQEIEASLSQDQIDQLGEVLNSCTVNNITVLIYDRQNQKMIYSTARESNGQIQSGIDANSWLQQAARENIFARLEKENPIVEAQSSGISDSIFLYSKLSDGEYLFMETPRAYLQSTAELAMRFFVAVSMLTLLVGGVVVYFVAKRIARPIRQIDETAQRIAEMDFSETCEIHTGDEIEALAGSVNKMAERLKENIDLLKRDLEREEKTNHMRRQFIANVTHDLKTPLALIQSYSEALQDQSVSEQEAVEVLQEQCDRMDRLVNQMLTLSRLESKTMQYHMSVFPIEELVFHVLQSFRLPIRQQEIQLDTDLGQGCVVEADYHKIVQVFTNLLENAVKYVDDKKRIRVVVDQSDSLVHVSVFNTHPSLTQEQLDNVFEMFYKADESRGVSSKNYGIGLAIVKNIVQAHGGTCGVRNWEDGVCFWFSLPALLLEEDEQAEFE